MTDEQINKIKEFLAENGISEALFDTGFAGNLEIDDSPQFEGWVSVKFDFNRGLRQTITRFVSHETGEITEDASKFEPTADFGNTFYMTWDPEDEEDLENVAKELQSVKHTISKIKGIIDRQKFLDAMGEEAS